MTFDEAQFDAMVLRSHQEPVIAFFAMPGCVPCKSLKPLVDIAAAKFDRPVFYMDVMQCKQAAMTLNVRSAPTVLRFEAGKEVARFSGLKPGAEVEKFCA